MSDLRSFLAAVRKHVGETVAGVAFTFVSLVWQIAQWINPNLQGPIFRPWLLAVLGLGLLFRATFLAWRDEHNERLTAETTAKNDAPVRPSLHVTDVALVIIHDEDRNLIEAQIKAEVRNLSERAALNMRLSFWVAYNERPKMTGGATVSCSVKVLDAMGGAEERKTLAWIIDPPLPQGAVYLIGRIECEDPVTRQHYSDALCFETPFGWPVEIRSSMGKVTRPLMTCD